ncbi:MAG: DUF4345 domain-containing protein [Pseudomonadota bacterium]
MRRALQVVIAILSLAPFGFGLTNLYVGAARYMPKEAVNAGIDSQFRFESGIYFSIALLLWWMIPRIERVTVPFRIVVLGIFIGALGRVLSYLQLGPAPGFAAFGMFFELSLILLLIWQAKVAKDHAGSA